MIYDQVDGCAMGSPLAPPLANLFMGVNETKWINDYEGNGPTFYKRYVYDIFAVFNDEKEANLFLNTQTGNILTLHLLKKIAKTENYLS